MVCASLGSITSSLKLGDYLSEKAHTPCSPVKLWENLKQIATKGFFAVMIFLDLQF